MLNRIESLLANAWKLLDQSEARAQFQYPVRRPKGHLYQCGKTRGAPTRIPLADSVVDRFVEIAWCCLHCHEPAASPQLRSLMEQFFCGTRRNRERWLVSIYRSKTQSREMGLRQSETARGPALVYTLDPRRKRSLHPQADTRRVGANAPLRSRKILKPRGLYLELHDPSEIWQAAVLLRCLSNFKAMR